MRKESLALLKNLVTTPGPSGFDGEIQAVCISYVKTYVDNVYKYVN